MIRVPFAAFAFMVAAGCGGTSPTQPAVTTFAAVSVGQFHACGVATSNTAYCWGYTGSGELGNGTTSGPEQCAGSSCSTRPVAVAGGLRFTVVSAGGRFTCGVTTAGSAYCWGFNGYGQLGDGTTTDRTSPVVVAGGLRFATVSAGGGHACGVTTAGAAYCWGDNLDGQLGIGSNAGPEACSTVPYPCSTNPVAVLGGLTFAAVSAGSEHTCGIAMTGASYCWGRNSVGELGDGSTTGPEHCPLPYGVMQFDLCSTTPTAVAGGLAFATVGAGTLFTCGVTTSGAAYCWGDNSNGQLGNGGTAMDSAVVPLPVAGGLRFSLVSAGAGNGFACGVTTTDAAYCWGYNFAGQLGNGTDQSSASPVAVAGGLKFATLTAGGTGGGLGFACGITTTPAVYCWGTDDGGQLGNGTSELKSPVPVPVVTP